MGDRLNVTIKEQRVKIYKVTIDKDILIEVPNNYDYNTLLKSIKTQYKNEAKLYLPEIVQIWSKNMNLFPNNIVYRYAKKKWASCSCDNILSFNPEIMKLPPHCIEYIVVHEIGHIKHKNHSKEFWSFIAIYIPNYKNIMEEIKNMSKNLFFL